MRDPRRPRHAARHPKAVSALVERPCSRLQLDGSLLERCRALRDLLFVRLDALRDLGQLLLALLRQLILALAVSLRGGQLLLTLTELLRECLQPGCAGLCDRSLVLALPDCPGAPIDVGSLREDLCRATLQRGDPLLLLSERPFSLVEQRARLCHGGGTPVELLGGELVSGKLLLALLQLSGGPCQLGVLLHELRSLLLQLLLDVSAELRGENGMLLTFVERPRGGFDFGLTPSQFLDARVESHCRQLARVHSPLTLFVEPSVLLQFGLALFQGFLPELCGSLALGQRARRRIACSEPLVHVADSLLAFGQVLLALIEETLPARELHHALREFRVALCQRLLVCHTLVRRRSLALLERPCLLCEIGLARIEGRLALLDPGRAPGELLRAGCDPALLRADPLLTLPNEPCLLLPLGLSLPQGLFPELRGTLALCERVLAHRTVVLRGSLPLLERP